MKIPEEFTEDNINNFPVSFIFSTIYRQHILYLKHNVEEHDITAGEHPIIMKLYHDGPKTQHEIAESFYITEGTIARTVRNLENKNIINREVDENNRRQNFISLTDKGINIALEIKNLEDEWENTTCNFLSKEELDHFKRTLYKITINSINSNK
ncbi:MAG: winged helix-turn-helix transcriptional regulator [Methanosphaera stadtmanae]|jgi:DNA-binding MarR family transcriptional regulator|nr:winged helix-turn-helix transcriptional regulator [Methanosphaera stadtmanae]